jgi:hypothetical protein
MTVLLAALGALSVVLLPTDWSRIGVVLAGTALAALLGALARRDRRARSILLTVSWGVGVAFGNTWIHGSSLIAAFGWSGVPGLMTIIPIYVAGIAVVGAALGYIADAGISAVKNAFGRKVAV